MKYLLILTLSVFLTIPLPASATTYTEQKPTILVTPANPEFTIKLKSNPTTGFSWFLREYDSRFIEPSQHKFQAAQDKKLMGAPGYEYWTFKVKPEAFIVPQQTTLRLIYARPWEKNDQSVGVVFWISTAGR